ncbi:hypothetical protein BY458DRAFT_432996 [Sporodiniella umbellata]|nr:hypothetical protein BY458DRAFT_432996 [Sporodiniella umbellata]
MTSQVVNQLSDTGIPVIVCSTIDDSNFMIECIQAGAANYVLQPLRLDVIKTLFLVLYRQERMNLYQDHHLIYSSTTLSSSSIMSPTTPTAGSFPSIHLPEGIQDRLKHWLQKEPNERQQEIFEMISHWDFSPLRLSAQDLIHCGVIILSQVFLLPDMDPMSQEQLYDFVIDLSNLYHEDNPYHNFSHAVDVLQCIYYFLCQIGLLPYLESRPKPCGCILRSMDIFALLIAAIGHDTGHPGVNNTFHAMTLFGLLKKHGFDAYLGGVESTRYKDFRKLVITSILATDMSLHGDYVTKIKEQNQRWKTREGRGWEDEDRLMEERLLFCSGLMKCADISNVARPFERAYEWAQILVEEFACQGDLEKELGFPVVAMNDRAKIVLEDSQIGFIQFVALGLFESLHGYLVFPVEQIKHNLSIWQERKREKEVLVQDALLIQAMHPTLQPPDYPTCSSRPVEEDWPTQGPVYCHCIIQ